MIYTQRKQIVTIADHNANKVHTIYLDRKRESLHPTDMVARVKRHAKSRTQGAVSLTYLGILKERFTPIFSATLIYGKRAFHHKKTGVTFPISLGKRRLSITFHIA